MYLGVKDIEYHVTDVTSCQVTLTSLLVALPGSHSLSIVVVTATFQHLCQRSGYKIFVKFRKQ